MDDTTNENWSLAEMARRLDASGDYRVLRRIDETTLNLTSAWDDEPTRVGVVIDVETEGLGSDHAIIELAVRRFRFNDAGWITAIGEVRVWREEPGSPARSGDHQAHRTDRRRPRRPDDRRRGGGRDLDVRRHRHRS